MSTASQLTSYRRLSNVWGDTASGFIVAVNDRDVAIRQYL
jgi:hypothetical protein